MKTLAFTKVQWTWNDFILIDNLDKKLEKINLTQNLIAKMCDRNFWIWSDWLLIIEQSSLADYKYTMYNSDWSKSEMCWNWVRCFMKYLIFKWLEKSWDSIKIETWVWILTLKYDWWLVEVDMWAPILERKSILISVENTSILSKDREFEFIWVSMWNPHCVIYLDEDLNLFDLEKYWPPIENNLEYFPNRINTEFVQFINSMHIKMRVWERGCGETLSCGTWVCASTVAWILLWKLEKGKDILVDIKWWQLIVNWSWEKWDRLIMKWSAEIVYEGGYLV